jgi:hypothetical protein
MEDPSLSPWTDILYISTKTPEGLFVALHLQVQIKKFGSDPPFLIWAKV